MGDLLGIATAILSRANGQAEVAAHNLANLATPGYKSQASFAQSLSISESIASAPDIYRQLVAGSPMDTGVPEDLMIAGDGFFELAGVGGRVLSRGGQFSRDEQGRLVNGVGLALQAVGGGDIVLDPGAFEVTAEGVVIQEGRPSGRVSVLSVEPDSMDWGAADIRLDDATIAKPSDAFSIRQGALETSNVSTGAEMVKMMEAVRRAETGQRLVNVYDDMLGRVVTTLGQSS